MTDELTVAVGSWPAFMLAGSTLIARNWPAWDRTPFPKPKLQGVDYVTLDELLDGPEATNADAWCPTEQRERLHAVRSNGWKRCWTCATEVPAGVAA